MQLQVSTPAAATASHAEAPPSKTQERRASGIGGTRLDQTTRLNMSASCAAAARLEITLPTPQANAATITSAKPTNVAWAPAISSCAASTAMPAVAMPAPTRLCRCKRSPRNAMARPMVKNTCTWITSDERPAGMPSFIPRNSKPNWKTPIARPYPATSRHGMRGRLITNTSGTAEKKKRSAASAKGGISRKPTLIGTNEKPQSVTTASVNSRSRGASACFMPPDATFRPGEASCASLARSCRASQLDHAAGAQRFPEGERDSRRLGRVVQCQERRGIVEHCIDKMRRLAQECLLESLIEGRRAFVAYSMCIGDVDAVKARVLADRESAVRSENLGRRLVPVRHGARRVKTCHLAIGEFAGRHTVVDVAEFPQALVQRHHAGRENAYRFGIPQQPAGKIDIVHGAVEEDAAAGGREAHEKARRIVHVEIL